MIAMLSLIRIEAGEPTPYYNLLRANAMGGAGIAFFDDNHAVWFNPALLGSAKIKVNIFDLNLGTGLSALNKMALITKAFSASSGLAGKAAPFYGLPVSIAFNGMIGVVVPNFSFSVFYQSNSLFMIRNPAYPEFNMNAFIDYGIISGTGFKIFDWLEIGLSGKYIFRDGFYFNGGFAKILSLIPSLEGGFSGINIQEFANRGRALGFNIGSRLFIPTRYQHVKWSLAATIDDLFSTRFLGLSETQGYSIPTTIDQQINLGTSVNIQMSAKTSLTVNADYRAITDTQTTIYKKIFVGSELDLNFISLQAGLYQGYLTYGFGLKMLPIFNFSFASYGVELGKFNGQSEDRRYMVQFLINMLF